MKTFLTEKHNIPEGATHYRNECDKRHFLWVKVDGDDVTVYIDSEGEFLSANWLKGGRYIGSVKPIPQANIETPEEKEVEWINGDTVEYHNKHEGEGGILTFVGIHPTHKDHAVLYGKHLNGGYMSAPLSMLSKPETEAERAERERLEAAYDLYCEFTNSNQEDATCMSMYGFKMSQVQRKWLAIVDKTNYRKESEL